MKSFYYIFVTSIVFLDFSKVLALNPQDIAPRGNQDVISSNASGSGLLDYLLAYLRDFIFGILSIIAIGVFLFIGAKLLVARGNPEEFSKTLKSFIYAAVGIFVVVFAWAAVRLVTSISLN